MRTRSRWDGGEVTGTLLDTPTAAAVALPLTASEEWTRLEGNGPAAVASASIGENLVKRG
jgi:hypothetical protein